MPGVERVQMVRDARIVFRQTPVMVVAVEIDEHRRDRAAARRWRANADEMYRRTAAGEGLMVSDNLAQLQHLTLGEIARDSGAGRRHPPADRRHRRRLLRSAGHDPDGPHAVRAVLARRFGERVPRLPEARAPSVAEVRQRILERYAGQRQVFVLTNAELKSYILKITDQWFGLTSVQIAVAVLVAILGIVNTLTVSITDRRRELGVLRAVGGLHGQIRRTIWIEALSIGRSGWSSGSRSARSTCITSCRSCITTSRACGSTTCSRSARASRSCRRSWRPRSSPRSGRRSRRCADRSSRRWNMSNGQVARWAHGSGGRVRRSVGGARRACGRLAVARRARGGRRAADRRGGAEAHRLRSRSATKGCCRCSTRRARSATSAGRFERLGSHGQSKAVLRFTAPAEVKGVALLVVNHPDRASDQWMWTPAIERDRRIALQDRSTRFFGTDFSFEDLEERDVDQYDYALARRRGGRRRRLLEDRVDAASRRSRRSTRGRSSGSARTTTRSRGSRTTSRTRSCAG